MSNIKMIGVHKRYGNTVASNIEYLEVKEGEILSFLGPSGCGKTTTLRIVAGLERQDDGDVYIGDRLVNDVPPEQRKAAMVFQRYALFPHMTVFENIAFGLRIRKFSKREIERKVDSVLELVKLPGMEKRYPGQLSGGQQQRIALARAVVIDPEVLLFDEPLSNLDAKLREYMRLELRNFLKDLKTTSIYVTHDQTEALALSDRVAVMDRGSVQQIDVPNNIYRSPKNKFVADFMANTSFIEVVVEKKDESRSLVAVYTNDGLTFWGRGGEGMDPGSHVLFCVRPENVKIFKLGEKTEDNVVTGIVVHASDLGEYLEYQVKIGQNIIRSKTMSRTNIFRKDDKIGVWLDPNGCFIINSRSQN
ncbi:MAG: ABC transporter ATP-binding protein [Pseudomonadota bacterium]